MKLKNKIVSAIMALAMAMSLVATTSFAAAGADGEISATASKVADLQPGEEFTVTVAFVKNPGLQLINLTAKADAGLTLIGAEECGKIDEEEDEFISNYKGGALSTNYSNNYTIFYNDSGSSKNTTKTKDLCTLTYKVNDDAATGNYNVVIESTEIKNKDKTVLDFGSATATVAVVGAAQEDNIVVSETPQTFVAVAENVENKTGVTFEFTTNFEKAANNGVGSANVAFNEEGTVVETAEKLIVGVTVSGIVTEFNGTPVTFDCTGVELY